MYNIEQEYNQVFNVIYAKLHNKGFELRYRSLEHSKNSNEFFSAELVFDKRTEDTEYKINIEFSIDPVTEKLMAKWKVTEIQWTENQDLCTDGYGNCDNMVSELIQDIMDENELEEN